MVDLSLPPNGENEMGMPKDRWPVGADPPRPPSHGYRGLQWLRATLVSCLRFFTDGASWHEGF